MTGKLANYHMIQMPYWPHVQFLSITCDDHTYRKFSQIRRNSISYCLVGVSCKKTRCVLLGMFWPHFSEHIWKISSKVLRYFITLKKTQEARWWHQMSQWPFWRNTCPIQISTESSLRLWQLPSSLQEQHVNITNCSIKEQKWLPNSLWSQHWRFCLFYACS